MHKMERMTIPVSFAFLSSQWFYLMEAMASARLSSRTLQSGAVSPAVLQKKVSDAESLISNTMDFTKI